MNKRYAAHYVLIQPDRILKQHYIELDHNNCMLKVAALTEEIAGTAFYDGILFPSLLEIDSQKLNEIIKEDKDVSLAELLFKSGIVASLNQKPVFIYQLTGVNLFAPEFGTSDCCSHCHIQRL